MNFARFTLRVEMLEGRRLMALPAVADLPVGHDASMTSEVSLVDVPASNATVAPFAFSLAVAEDGASHVLVVQFKNLDQRRLVGIAGGTAEWTDALGIARIPMPAGVSRIELTIADQPRGDATPFVRVDFDQRLGIASVSRLFAATSGEQEGETPLNSSPVGLTGDAPMSEMNGIGQSSVGGHHADTGVTPSTSAYSLNSNRAAGLGELDGARDHAHGADMNGMNSPAAGVAPSAASGATNLGLTAMLGSSQAMSPQHEMDFAQLAPLENELPESNETVDHLFAAWGDDEMEPALVTELASVALVPPTDVPPDDTPPILSAIPLFASTDAPAMSPGDCEPTESVAAWQIASAIFIAASSAGGAFWLERRARKVRQPRPAQSQSVAPVDALPAKLSKAS